jgi:ABC-type phosphate transport system substrate-binding protein
MSVRKSIAGFVSAAVTGAVLVVSATPAFAADPDDPSFTPTAADLIGVGSDTTQHAVHLLAEGGTVNGTAVPGWNAAHTPLIASFAATGGGDIALPSGSIPRPNGSGAGKTLLYGASNNTDIDFARSSSSLNTAEISAGLKQFPFALDTLKMAVSNNVPSNAPASLTGAQVLSIYKGDAITWDQVGGASTATIAPKIPQSGSGTRSFFLAQLKALNGGVDVTLGQNVAEVQEHDDTLIKGDANAIAPFSVGRAALLGTTLRLEGGWSAQRALYDVVRGADLANTDLQAVFGEDGFACSTAARSLIEASGFQQLATPAHGGVCGQATQDPTSNFTLNQQVDTLTVLTGTNPAAGKIHLSAAVTASSAPDGTVDFLEGATVLQAGVPLAQGKATLDLTGVAKGNHTYTAKFVPTGGTAFDPSQDEATVMSRGASATAITFTPSTTSYGHPRTIKATVTTGGVAATGSVSIKVGTAAAVTKALSSGAASLVVPATKAAGSYAVVVKYLGNATTLPSQASKTLVIAKAKPVISETFPLATLVGQPGKGTVKVAIANSTIKPTGTVLIKLGTKVLVKGTLSSGQVALTLPKLSKGTHTLTIVYSGSVNVATGSLSFTITQK